MEGFNVTLSVADVTKVTIQSFYCKMLGGHVILGGSMSNIVIPNWH